MTAESDALERAVGKSVLSVVAAALLAGGVGTYGGKQWAASDTARIAALERVVAQEQAVRENAMNQGRQDRQVLRAVLARIDTNLYAIAGYLRERDPQKAPRMEPRSPDEFIGGGLR